MLYRLTVGVAMVVAANAASALDVSAYKALAESTIRQMDMGVVGDIDEVIAAQEELMVIGIEGSVDYLVANPQGGQALSLVVLNAEKMKALNIDQIEKQWHEGDFLRGKGVDPDKIDHFGAMNSLMDAIIHPATAYILLKEYKQTGNSDLLARVKGELLEVLEHIKHVHSETQITEAN